MQMKNSIPLALCFYLHTLLQAQTTNPLLSGSELPKYAYRSTENEYYWKNRKPDAGYWQQDVHYNIVAEVNDSTDIISGTVTLTYYNNSPDTLPYVYFHLYQEAFQPESYADDLNRANKNNVKYGNYETQKLGTEVEKIKVISINGFRVMKETELIQDNTILRANLEEAILPGGFMTFEIPFQTYFDNGGARRRMKMFDAFGNNHYDGVHWYPRMCVYDRRFGWETQQHLGKEFYGDYGSYDVSLTFPSHYILDATGVLTNPETVMPEDLRKKLDITNFATKEWNSAPSVIIEKIPGEKKTWKYSAINVHDFAFTADPTYRIGETTALVNGKKVSCIALVQEPHAAGWQNAAEYTKQVIETNSKYFGAYLWPKIIVADAQDGMEYPMLTLDGGFDPYYRDLLAHEVGHQWFFGMVGNNETYRAALDEGFTQFLTAFTYIKIDGDTVIEYPETKKYTAKYRKPTDTRFTEAYFGYLNDAVRNNDAFLNTHSDDFNSALGHGGGYRHVYYKTAVMLYNLQYVLGDELFQNAMKHYFEKWKLCHPYFEDFRDAITEYTHADLTWFFDAWLETKKNIDYAVKDVKQSATVNLDGQMLNTYKITFKRKGEMQMPIDFIVINSEGDTIKYHIPNTWFNKYENENSGISFGRLNSSMFQKTNVLPKWTGWGKLNEEYTAEINLPAKIQDVIIDPSNRLADVNKLDNSWKCPVDWSFDSHIWNYPDWNNYELNWRPDVWYNTVDLAKIGLHFNGNYINFKHQFEFTGWFNTGSIDNNTHDIIAGPNTIGQMNAQYFSFDLNYKTSTDKFLPNSNFFFDTKLLDGVFGFKIGEEFPVGKRKQDKVTVYYNDVQYLKPYYLLYGENVSEGKNNAFHISYEHDYRYSSGYGKLKLAFRTDDLLSDYDYQYVNLEELNTTKLGKFDLQTRLFAQWGGGENIPFESALMLAGANQETLLDNKYTRAEAFFPQSWTEFSTVTNHFHAGGGLNLRGYAGYYAAETGADSTIYATYFGTSGASINAELAFDRMFTKKQLISFIKMTPYLFFDAGCMAYKEADGKNSFGQLRMDAGIGSAFTWSWWGPLEEIKPFTVRFDMPLFLNHPPFDEPEYIKFRYVIGIERAF